MNRPVLSHVILREKQFRKLPPNLSILQTANRLAISYADAYRYGRRFSYQFKKQLKGRKRQDRSELMAKFEALPPELTIAEAAQELRLSLDKTYRFGRQAGYGFRRATMAGRGTSRQVAWMARIKGMPPNLSIKEIAKKLDISYGYAQHLVQKAVYEFRKSYRFQRVSAHRWDEVDWSLPDAQVARTLGVSRERVRQVRQQRGIAKPSRQVYHRSSVKRTIRKDSKMTTVSARESSMRPLADNAIAKRAMEAVEAINREAQQKKLAQLHALEAAQRTIQGRIGEFQHQLELLDDALAAIRPGARQRMVQHSGGRRDHDSLRVQVKEWMKERREQRFAARDIVQAFPQLEGTQLSMLLKPSVEDGTISRDFTNGVKRPRYFVRDTALL